MQAVPLVGWSQAGDGRQLTTTAGKGAAAYGACYTEEMCTHNCGTNCAGEQMLAPV